MNEDFVAGLVPREEGEVKSEAFTAAFSWTTQDEIDFIDSLYEGGKESGDWAALRRYPQMIFLRRWDSTVDVEKVRLHARKRAADVEFFLALKEG